MSRTRPIQHGDVLEVAFPVRSPLGREQTGTRPAVVIMLPELAGYPRYAVAIVAPLTRDQGQPWIVQGKGLYPIVEANTGGVPLRSVVQLDQITTVDVTRIKQRLGTLTEAEYAPILERVLRISNPEGA